MQKKFLGLMVASVFVVSGCASISTSATLPEGVSLQSVKKKEGNLAWWKDYPDKEVVSLVDSAVSKNLSLQSLQARLEAARLAAEVPSSSIAPSGVVSLSSAKSIFGNGAELTKAANASWTLPLYEKAENSKLLNDSKYLQVLWNTEASKQILAGNVLVAYTNQQLAIMRYKVAKDNWFLQTQLLNIMRNEHKAGTLAEKEVRAQERLVEDYRVLKDKALSLCITNNHTLAAYLGVNDFESLSVPEFTWQSHLSNVAVDDPMVLKNRPDIKMAEAKLLEAGASLGIAAADLMPQLQLSFNSSKSSNTPSLSVMGAQLTLPLLNWYLLEQQHKITSKYFEESVYAYNDALVNAWSEVGKARSQWAVAISAEQAAMSSLESMTKDVQRVDTEYRVGKASYKDVIQMQLAHGSAKLNYYDSYLAKVAAWVKVKQETLN